MWRCPYYRNDYADKLSCDAGKIKMRSRDELRSYEARFCASYGWEGCSLAITMNETEERKNARKQQGQGAAAGKGAARG